MAFNLKRLRRRCAGDAFALCRHALQLGNTIRWPPGAILVALAYTLNDDTMRNDDVTVAVAVLLLILLLLRSLLRGDRSRLLASTANRVTVF